MARVLIDIVLKGGAGGYLLSLNRPLPVNGSGRWGILRSGIKEEQSAKAAAEDGRVAECAVGLISRAIVTQACYFPMFKRTNKLTYKLTNERNTSKFMENQPPSHE